ncbi:MULTISPECIES: FAD-dependent oxidoreductase [unclassified Hyphomicrobium]|uniref:oxidoreductase n=1 Tax=unclassified Hyphomicrobium TaxID=2619925 RepID=UPI000213E92D|nr:MULTISPECIES: FAD-dependent oxidoreductase [unclassified Hyphomicrobium]CCB67171.1 NADH:flavin oxidoreductase/NADH oxidase [Hyphomicrobium sp. MC1]
MRDPRYDILFEPVKIGPVTTKNRFYQVPHCNGMGYRDPTALATMRAIKAEGGWGVVCTEQVEIHPTGDIAPFIELRNWDDQDVPMLSRIADAIHSGDALAGLQLAHNGMNSPNQYSREIPFGPVDLPVFSIYNDPVQARAMDATDIRNLRRWHREAAVRGKRAGYDIIYIYAGKLFGGAMFFLSRRYNTRTDEYGGSLENRARLLKELIEDTKEAVGDRCAVACRISVDELIGEEGLHAAEARDIISHLAEIPDLWDLTLSSWDNDSQTSRFSEEGYQEPFVTGIKALTTKPVVGVGRFTSPDTMVRMVKSGVLDLIGAARPSIADPFLPKKINEGRHDDIRECIGCNMCVSGDHNMTPIRCTQNPSMGEEWRRNWHPEYIRPSQSANKVLVVGSGPAGLEASMMLGRRGYSVALAERNRTLGGRVARERRLPGLSAWGRVADYRIAQLEKLNTVEIFRESDLTADDILSFGFENVVIATGSHWRSDGIGRHLLRPVPVTGDVEILTPDVLMNGTRPRGKNVVIYDDDHYYMGGVLAELLVKEGCSVTLVTPAALVSIWMQLTMEQHRVQARLMELGVKIVPQHVVTAISEKGAETICLFTNRPTVIPAESIVMVTARLPDHKLATELEARRSEWSAAGLMSVSTVGDALAPGTIAAAVFGGRRYAEELDAPVNETGLPFRREVASLSMGPLPWQNASEPEAVRVDDRV